MTASRDIHASSSGSVWNPKIGKQFCGHSAINHAIEEYVRGGAHVNNAENYFSIFKRGINGIYHHITSAMSTCRFTWPKLIFAIMSAAAVA